LFPLSRFLPIAVLLLLQSCLDCNKQNQAKSNQANTTEHNTFCNYKVLFGKVEPLLFTLCPYKLILNFTELTTQTEEVNKNKKISKFARPLLLRNAERVL